MPVPTTPDPTYVGTLEPLQQGSVLTIDQQRGGTYVEHHRGYSIDQLKARIASYSGSFQRAILEDRFGIGDLRLEWASDSNGNISSPDSLAATQDRWEVADPTEPQDILTHPYFYDIILGAAEGLAWTSDCISIIRRHAEAAKSSAEDATVTEQRCIDAFSDYLTGIGRSLPANNDWLYFYRLYANNQTHYQAATYALRHTTNAPAYWSRNVADANINRVYTNAQFLTEIGDATLWVKICPPRLAYKLTAAYSTFASDHYSRTGYTIGWLKSPSAESDVGGGRIEIQTTYRLDQWPIALYPLAT